MNSLRTRLLVAYAGVILIGFVVLALLAGRQISAGTVDDFSNSLGEQADIVARALHDSVEHATEGEVSTAALQNALQTYAGQTDTEVALFGNAGGFWVSSSGSAADFTAEVDGALSGTTTVNTRGSLAYAAAPVLEDGRILAAVLLSAPLSGAQALVVQRWLTLGLTVLGVTAVAAVAAVWLSATLTRPLTRLQEAALQIAGGDFSPRLPAQRQDEIGEVARAFNHMTTQVEAMLEEQRAFASTASHELRTPLTTVRLRSEALRYEELDAATTTQYVTEIDEEVQRLGNLVQDLLLISRLDAGRLETGHEQIDMLRLARQLVAEVQPQADARGLTLRLNAPNALPITTAAQTHLALVFRNVLGNALKYTPDGGHITWEIEATAVALRHTLTDSGQGMAADDVAHAFDRFYRADKSRSRQVPGVGLGLSLVRMIVRFYGGDVTVTSPGPGQGTAVSITWPLKPEER